MELFAEQFQHPAVGFVFLVQEVDNHHIELLAVTMAATNALFYPLGVPGQVVVNDQAAKLQVNPFGSGLGSDQDFCVFFKVVDQCCSPIYRRAAGDLIGIRITLQPALVYAIGGRIAVCAAERRYFALETVTFQVLFQVILGSATFGKDNRFALGTHFCHMGKPLIQGGQQGFGFGIVGNAVSQIKVLFKLGNFCPQGAEVDGLSGFFRIVNQNVIVVRW